MPSIETDRHVTATHRVAIALADLRATPDADAERISQALHGERLRCLDESNGWCHVAQLGDGYRGFVRRADLVARVDDAPTHVVGVRQTLAFAEPDIKSPDARPRPLGSELTLVEQSADGRFMRDDLGGWYWADHCQPVDDISDAPATALARAWFEGTPYLWGGRSPVGCDCSALVQLVAARRGVSLPRDSGDQERAIAEKIDFEARTAEDLVFWRGHVAWLLDRERVLHLTAHSLAFAIEPLTAVIARAGEPTSVARMPC